MRPASLILFGMLLIAGAGCTPKEPPLPPVPAMPADLSPAVWTAPEVVEVPLVVDLPPALPPVRPASPSEKVYAYEPYQEYVIPIRIGTSADIVLEAGELVHNIVPGDRSLMAEGHEKEDGWAIREGVSETQYTPIRHIFVTATQVGIEQGIVVTTSRRTYHLQVKSVGKSPIRTVRWTYPPPPVIPKKLEPPLLPERSTPQGYHVGYVIESPGPTPDWVPTQVLDDGKKTYMLFSPVMLYQDAPLLRLRGPNGFEVVNVRQVRTVYIIDRLISHAELRVGAGEHAVIVTIRRGELQRIACPGHADCPQWPDLRAPRVATSTPMLP